MPPIVSAHSVGGLLLPLVAKQRPVARMVFPGAAIPQIGKSALQRLLEEMASGYATRTGESSRCWAFSWLR
jgi:hypothetical protein